MRLGSCPRDNKATGERGHDRSGWNYRLAQLCIDQERLRHWRQATSLKKRYTDLENFCIFTTETMHAGGVLVTDSEQPALTLDFSTDNLPFAGRVAAVREYLEDLMRVDVHALNPASPLHYRARLRMVEGASFGSALVTSIMSSRTSLLLKDGQDDLLLGMAEMEMVVEVPGKGETTVCPGDALLLSFAREMRLTVRGSGRLRGLRIPRKAIAYILPRLGSAPIIHIRRGTPMLSLLYSYIGLLEEEPLAGNLAQQTAARHAQELLALAIGASGDFQEQAEDDTVAAARMMTVRAAIAEHLSNPNLGIRWIAAQRQVTPRHLQRLFAQAGTCFTDVLREARVARARTLIEDPRNADRTIVSIALECGFPEASALNRAFKREFGLTPGEARWKR